MTHISVISSKPSSEFSQNHQTSTDEAPNKSKKSIEILEKYPQGRPDGPLMRTGHMAHRLRRSVWEHGGRDLRPGGTFCEG